MDRLKKDTDCLLLKWQNVIYKFKFSDDSSTTSFYLFNLLKYLYFPRVLEPEPGFKKRIVDQDQ
jgi:hypothetical protein